MAITYLLALIAVLAVVFLLTGNPEAKEKSRGWLKAGGWLGFAILLARLTRMPLATILSAMPLILRQLKNADARQRQNHPSPAPAMSREEAALILGVSAGAPQEEIKQAHRQLIAKNHPDKGGSDWLAARINQARDILLK